MNLELVDEFARALRRARAEVYRTVARTNEELTTLEMHQAGSLGEDVNTDLATAVLSHLEGHEKHALDEIDAAQARLAAGTYGVCEECSAPIPLTRLRALPTARYCVPCQRKHER